MSNVQTYLSLAVNRLSGPLPSSISSLSSANENLTFLNVLTSNVFQCQHPSDLKNKIPSSDEYSNTYSCGSSDLEVPLYLWVFFSIIILIVTMGVIYITPRHLTYGTVSSVSMMRCVMQSFTNWLYSWRDSVDKSIYWWRISNALLIPNILSSGYSTSRKLSSRPIHYGMCNFIE